MRSSLLHSGAWGVFFLSAVVAGCSATSSSPSGDGAGATGGTGGSAGSAGTAGNAASAGSAGSGAAGSAGAGGSTGGTAGTSGTSGTSGTAGTGGTSTECPAGQQDCDGDLANGCETSLTDVGHCGACDVVCPPAPHAQPTCTAAGCGFKCDDGFEDCNGDPADGCERNTNSDTLHCSICNNACPGAPGASPKCTNGVCGLSCDLGYADCDGDIVANGCEVNLTSDPNNCGDCNFACAGPAGQTVCSASHCAIQCPPGFGNCDGDPLNGCEADLDHDVLNCGACDQSCGASACVSGGCECAGTTATAQPIPVDMYVMLDKSGSMLEYVDPPTNSITRWEVVTSALSQFVQAPTSSGLGVGLQFFPLGGSEPYSCEQWRYSNAAVSIGTLADGVDAQETAVIDALNTTTPLGGTPSRVALNGALEYAKLWKAAHPSHKVVVVLATDGEPQGCASNLVNTADSAQTGNSYTTINTQDGPITGPPVQTYVIGVGSALSNLTVIAQAGGTQDAFVLSDSGDPAAFIAAMDQIRKAAVGCDYSIPAAPVGQQFDKNKVNVVITPGAGTPLSLTGATGLGACDPLTGGWYYDDPANPTKIVLCPASCASVSADLDATVDIILGCATKGQ